MTAAALAVLACADGGQTYLDRRASFHTQLTDSVSSGALPGDPTAFPTWEVGWGHWEEAVYPSGDLELMAYVFRPNAEPPVERPAFVYLHPGLFNDPAVRDTTIADTKAIVEAGFVVLVPAFRGEAGNPGVTEFWLGEVDDAAAAARWLVRQPYVDASHVYVMGWSYGGAVAALLSLLPDVPIRHSASFGGLATRDVFGQLSPPFDIGDSLETGMRMLIGNVRWMQRAHVAYLGSADAVTAGAAEAVRREVGDAASLLEIIAIPGEHAPPAARTAIGLYLRRIQEETDPGE